MENLLLFEYMEQKKLKNRIYIVIIILIIILNLIYNMYNPSFEEICDIAYSEYVDFAHKHSYNINDFSGPFLDLKNKKYYIFTWKKISKGDTIIINFNFKKNSLEEPFITGYDSKYNY